MYIDDPLKVRERIHASGLKLRNDFKLNVECSFNTFAEVGDRAKD